MIAFRSLMTLRLNDLNHATTIQPNPLHGPVYPDCPRIRWQHLYKQGRSSDYLAITELLLTLRLVEMTFAVTEYAVYARY